MKEVLLFLSKSAPYLYRRPCRLSALIPTSHVQYVYFFLTILNWVTKIVNKESLKFNILSKMLLISINIEEEEEIPESIDLHREYIKCEGFTCL